MLAAHHPLPAALPCRLSGKLRGGKHEEAGTSPTAAAAAAQDVSMGHDGRACGYACPMQGAAQACRAPPLKKRSLPALLLLPAPVPCCSCRDALLLAFSPGAPDSHASQ